MLNIEARSDLKWAWKLAPGLFCPRHQPGALIRYTMVRRASWGFHLQDMRPGHSHP